MRLGVLAGVLGLADASGAYQYLRVNVTQSVRGSAGGRAVLAEVRWWAGASLSWFEPSAALTEWDRPLPYRATCSGAASGQEPCWNAFDHLPETAWRSAGTFDPVTGLETTMDGLEWLTLDLGAERMLDPTAVSLLCDPWAEERDYRDCPRSFSALGSADGQTWDVLGEWSGLEVDDWTADDEGELFWLDAALAVDAAAVVCPVGSYLLAEGAGCAACPAGRYGAEAGLDSAECSGPCAAGHYCTEGASVATEFPCGDAGFFCPEGSAVPGPVWMGFYSSDDGSAQAECPRGSFCAEGLRADCPAGTYGNLTAETRELCEGRCPFGTQCDVGSTAPTACPAGYFCPTGWQTWPCPAGRYGDADGESSSLCSGACPEGHYCPSGTVEPEPCPAGRYGGEEGLGDAGCSGECWAGYYCEEAATAPDQHECGAGHYCAAGAAAPSEATPGFFLAGGGGGAASAQAQAQAVCPLGAYCVDGEQLECPAGRYGAERGLASAECSGACEAGHYCPAGSTSATAEACPAGRYGSAAGETDEVCDGNCPEGHYCVGGAAEPEPCPAGRYGGEEGLSSAECSGACAAGHYCGEGATVATESLCGSASFYCPSGSAGPSAVAAGHYSTAGASAQAQCAPGAYCVDGEQRECPAGRYGAEWGLASAECSGACEAGHYCPAGSTSATEEACPAGRYGSEEALSSPFCSGVCAAGYYCPLASTNDTGIECGSVDVFCPEGARAPKAVDPGYFSTGGLYTLATALRTRSGQAACEPGQYCPGSGLALDCPAGRYGARSRLSSADCSGACARGHYCPAGSTVARAEPCPAGRYGDEAGLASEECSGVCVSGQGCPAGTVSPTLN